MNVDKLTYAGNQISPQCCRLERYSFEQVDICDSVAVNAVFAQYQADVVMHLVAESHLDRSIDGPGEFIQTNIIGTYTLLEAAAPIARSYLRRTEISFVFIIYPLTRSTVI